MGKFADKGWEGSGQILSRGWAFERPFAINMGEILMGFGI